jgi:hypothetical protein
MITFRHVVTITALVALSVPASALDVSRASAAASPATVVEAYYDAINDGDYEAAWQLGGKNLGGDFDRFADGFDGTLYDFVSVEYTRGDVVHVDLAAEQDNGSDHEYVGTYTVRDGEIVAAHLRRV